MSSVPAEKYESEAKKDGFILYSGVDEEDGVKHVCHFNTKNGTFHTEQNDEGAIFKVVGVLLWQDNGQYNAIPYWTWDNEGSEWVAAEPEGAEKYDLSGPEIVFADEYELQRKN